MINNTIYKLEQTKESLISLQGKRYMVTFITSHHKHKVSLQHSVTFSTNTIEGTYW